MAAFDSFVMLGGMRTGSNLLEALLNELPGVACHGEIFNPHFIGKKDQREFLGMTMAARDADPFAMLARLGASGRISGFRLFHDHDPRIIDAVLADQRCAKIVLTRNPVESYVSLKIAQATGQWKLTNAKNLKTDLARFDPPEFETFVAAAQAFHRRILRDLQTSGQTAFWLDYEDIGELTTLNGLARFLGVAPQAVFPDVKLKKQNPGGLGEKVSNPADMASAVSNVDWANLSRVPSFEPRRGAALPSICAGKEVPLLFMPVRGGPAAQIVDWLARFSGGVENGFDHNGLRRWKQAHPGHRSFTVLRHPVARAYSAFRERVLSEAMPEVGRILARQYGVDLLAPPAHRAAFLAFLRFIKANLAGQSNLRVDAYWATQSAILHGFAQVQTPDAVLREDRLEQGLAWLASEVGQQKSPVLGDQPETPGTLSDIYDAEIEAAAREAYQRDYLSFGFGNWR